MDQIELTPAEMQALQAELAELEGPRRAEMVEAIATARGFGDLSENFEYHAAKNEQDLLERQITLLREKIENAVVVEDPSADGRVAIGSQVTFADETGDQEQVTISNAGAVGTVSAESPLGRALYGAAAGDKVEVAAPRGSWVALVLAVA